MPRSKTDLIDALRTSARRLSEGAHYEWGHVGRCNCGHLVQTVCGSSAVEIRKSFGQTLDEWSEHANDYCLATGLPVEQVFEELDAIGFDRQDVRHLENLSDRRVLGRMPEDRKHLKRNQREDVILYMEQLAEILAEDL